MPIPIYRLIAFFCLPLLLGYATYHALSILPLQPGYSSTAAVLLVVTAYFHVVFSSDTFFARNNFTAQNHLRFLLRLAPSYALVPISILLGHLLSARYDLFPPLTTSFFLAAAAVGAVLYFLPVWSTSAATQDDYIRGRKLLSYEEARQRADTLKSPDDRGIPWGGLYLPSDAAYTHFCVAGATGSGKTITLATLLREAAAPILNGQDCRAVIYDAKKDIVSRLARLGFAPGTDHLHILNPFDSRASAWDVAADITDPNAAKTIAEILIPEDKQDHSPYFSNAARDLLQGVLRVFILTERETDRSNHEDRKSWGLHDVITAMSSPRILKALLAKYPTTKHLIDLYFQPETTFHNVISTVRSKIGRYETAAAAWSHAERKVSLTSWVKQPGILVLGADESIREAIDPINRVLFRRLAQIILSQTESTTRKTWIFLDELQKAGKLDDLDSLLLKGRSYGTCIVLGFQDVEGLRSVYGEKEANAMLGQCHSKAILQLTSAETARWASSLIGREHRYQYTTQHSRSFGPSGSSTSEATSEGIVTEDAVLDSEFLSLPLPRPETGLPGYYINSNIGAWPVCIPGDVVERFKLLPEVSVPDFVHRDPAHQELRPWTTEDAKRFGLKVAASQKPKPKREQVPPESSTTLDEVTRITRPS